MKRTYRVEIQRKVECMDYATIEVEADSADEAARLAVDGANECCPDDYNTTYTCDEDWECAADPKLTEIVA